MGPFLQVGGQWTIVQDNGFRVLITITQNQDQLSAFAETSSNQSIEAKGFVRGPDFDMTINWRGGARGHYTGTLTHGFFTPPPSGFLKGRTVDLSSPESTAGWESEGRVFQVA